MSKPAPRSLWKVIGTDALAGLCLIGVVLFGWLPGPGGIPLLILALSLLAANHEWARRWLVVVKKKGVNIKDKLFPEHPVVKWAYDVISILLVVAGVYLIIEYQLRWLVGLYILAICLGVALFLFNRQRIDKIMAKVRRKS